MREKLKTLFSKKEINKSYAIVIGLSDYVGGWPALESPFNDALRMKEFLINQAEFDVVITLTNAEASLTNITKYMEEIIPKLIKDTDRFLFYFSGHGTQRRLGSRFRGCLPMLKSGKSTWSDMISMDDIERWNENIQGAKHTLFVLDCCFSGLAGYQKKTSAKELYIKDLARYGHHLITAGTADQTSFGSLKRWGGSLFTDAFIKGASGKADAETADYPKDGVVSLNELYEYIKKRIKQESAIESRIGQSPQIAELGDNEGEFFFVSDIATATAVSKIVPHVSATSPVPESKGTTSINKGGDNTGRSIKTISSSNTQYYISPLIGYGYPQDFSFGFGLRTGITFSNRMYIGAIFTKHLGVNKVTAVDSLEGSGFYFGGEIGYIIERQTFRFNPYFIVGGYEFSLVDGGSSSTGEGLAFAAGLSFSFFLRENVTIGPDIRGVLGADGGGGMENIFVTWFFYELGSCRAFSVCYSETARLC